MDPKIVGGIIGAAGVALVNFVIYLIRNKVEVPEHLRKNIEDQQGQINSLNLRLAQKDGEIAALKAQLEDVQAKYIETVRVVMELQDESSSLKKQVEQLESKLGRVKQMLVELDVSKTVISKR